MTKMTCDVAVIGGGMAGASVAAELAQRRSVVLLEAEPVAGVHSTGRSAASYLPSYGGQAVRRLTVASRPLFDAWSSALGIELMRPRPLIWLSSDAASDEAAARMLRENVSLQSLTAAQATALCPVLRPERILTALLDSSAMDIDVAGLHHGYLSELKRRRGRVFYKAPVTQIRRSPGAWLVTVGEHTISCGAVVNAAGAWVDEVAERADVPPVGVQPKLRSAFTSKPQSDAAIAGSALVADACERWYFKPEVGSVLASPADESDSPPCDARPDEVAIAQAIDAINEATTLRLRSVMRAWAGLRSFVPDRSPVVGARRDHEGFCFLAGQGGYGIQMAPALALVAADIVADGTLSASVRAYGVTAEELSPDRFTTGRFAASAGSRPLLDTRQA